MKINRDEALRKLEKIIRANTGERTYGQFDQESEDVIEDINELKSDLTELINYIYDHNG